MPIVLLVLITISFLFSNSTIFSKYSYSVSKIISQITISILTLYSVILILKIFLEEFLNKQDKSILNLFNEHCEDSILMFSNSSLSIFSNAILLLSITIGLVTLHVLGEQQIFKKITNINIFSIFILATYFMVYTVNILIMFISFELLFIPTIYYVYVAGYIKRSEIAMSFLFKWTLGGAFLVLTALSYVYSVTGSFNYTQILNNSFSNLEKFFISLTIFLGFSVKVPMFPFHFWLTKVHVEAPAGFSIYLSGFLVKAAIYCLSILLHMFSEKYSTIFFSGISLFGVIEASLKMWTQTDLKKTIAFATIQEMNIIVFLLLNLATPINTYTISFILMHGWLSGYMFFLVDVIQKKMNTRNIVAISDISNKIPELKIYIWRMLIISSGFPLTIKFFVEYLFIGVLLGNFPYLITCILILSIGIGTLGFFKQFLLILYKKSYREKSLTSPTLNKKDKIILSNLTFMLILLTFVVYVF